MTKETHTQQNVLDFMRDNDLSADQVLSILKEHVNHIEFEKDLNDFYNGDGWGDWAEGDLV